MARIRTLKPEILEDAKTASLSHEAFRLFIGVITLADDHGALRGDVDWLRGQVFWACPATGDRQGVEDAIDELASAELVGVYEVRGQRYVQVTGWSKHQKVDHPGKPRVPRPDDSQAWRVPLRHPTRVYFIQAENSRAIKIGVSWNPSRRLASVQNGHHESLSLLGETPGGVELERDLHRRFADSRLSGEWFACTAQLLETVRELCDREDIPENPRLPSRESSDSLASDLGPKDHDHDRDQLARRKASRSKPKSTLSDDWSPTEDHGSRAMEFGLDVNREAEMFRNHAAQNDRRCADWNAAFRNWLLSSFERKGGSRPSRPTSRQTDMSTQDILEFADELAKRGM